MSRSESANRRNIVQTLCHDITRRTQEILDHVQADSGPPGTALTGGAPSQKTSEPELPSPIEQCFQARDLAFERLQALVKSSSDPDHDLVVLLARSLAPLDAQIAQWLRNSQKEVAASLSNSKRHRFSNSCPPPAPQILLQSA